MPDEKKYNEVDRIKVRDHFNQTAIVQPNDNSVLDSNTEQEVVFANIYRNYFTKHYIQKYVSPKKQDTLLDFGCGVGRIAFFLSPKVKRIEGVDVAKNMLEVATKKSSGFTNVHFSLLHDLTLPIKSEELNKVVSHWVLQHISDDDCSAYFEEFYRVLKPGGKLFLFEQVKSEGQQAGHIHVFRTINQYCSLLEAAGFTKIMVKPVMRVPSRGMSLWNRLKFNNRLLLRLLTLLDDKLMNRKIQFVEYYTILFEFEKASK
jgi:SAM-dependent methyltransferase